ncbi:MAG: hypothetical protein ABEK36_04395, partial [Candidatus Aenigmatarchaeota archaeon]
YNPEYVDSEENLMKAIWLIQKETSNSYFDILEIPLHVTLKFIKYMAEDAEAMNKSLKEKKVRRGF